MLEVRVWVSCSGVPAPGCSGVGDVGGRLCTKCVYCRAPFWRHAKPQVVHKCCRARRILPAACQTAGSECTKAAARRRHAKPAGCTGRSCWNSPACDRRADVAARDRPAGETRLNMGISRCTTPVSAFRPAARPSTLAEREIAAPLEFQSVSTAMLLSFRYSRAQASSRTVPSRHAGWGAASGLARCWRTWNSLAPCIGQ